MQNNKILNAEHFIFIFFGKGIFELLVLRIASFYSKSDFITLPKTYDQVLSTEDIICTH